jgi:hypothetical protein
MRADGGAEFDGVAGDVEWLEGVIPFVLGARELLTREGGPGWCLLDLLAQLIAEVQARQDVDSSPETERTLGLMRAAMLSHVERQVRLHGTSDYRPDGYEPPAGFKRWR